MIKLLVIPSQEFSTTYSGTRYLLSELSKRGVFVTVFLRVPPERMSQYAGVPFKIDFFTWWSPCWPKWKRVISILYYRILILFRLMRARAVLLTESLYLPEVTFVKRLRPSMCFIQYCQELHIPEEYPQLWSAKQYGKYAHIADLVLDVEPHRAQIRKQRFSLRSLPIVIRNTLPYNLISHDGSFSELTGCEIPKDRPIVLYAGGIGVEKPFSRIIHAIAAQKGCCRLVAFCATTPGLLWDAQAQAAKSLPKGSYLISGGVNHDSLIRAMHEADIGLVDYSYSIEPTTNQKFCAPTKLYEYLAAGLAVVGSNNESLREVIENNHVGFCAETDSDASFAEALTRVIANVDEMRARAANVFREKYSYEKCCIPAVDEIYEWLKKRQ